MKDPTQDPEALLEDLVRATRMGPPPMQAQRLEQKLSPWLDSKPTPAAASRGLAKIAIAVVGVVAVAVLWQTHEESIAPATKRVPNTWLAPQRAGFVRDEVPSAIEKASASAPETRAARRPTTSDRSIDLPGRPDPTASADDVAATVQREPEVDFLRRAQAALATSPSEALKMADDHSSLYPRGILVQEREVIAIDALTRLGRRAEAVARANAFRAAFPKSAHLSRVAALTEAP